MLGETISHYKVLEKLGQGGMGEVYLAEDTRLGRKVALKFLAPELARDRESLARFRTEAKAAAELSHPNIATIYDIGETPERPYLVLEYLRGQSLRTRIKQGPLPIEETLRIGKALAEGLAAAHSHGIVHRDVKSANIMLAGDGGVKILDFGLARLGDATQLTRPGTTLGTIYYMSPEQALGKTADERSDIWSLGVVLYECVTGRLPFKGEAGSVLAQVKSAKPDPPTAVRSGVPLELEQMILRCLEKDPSLRYQDAVDLLAKLKAIEKHLETDASTHSSVQVPSKNSRRKTWLSTAIVVFVIVGAGTFYRMLQDDTGSSAVIESDGFSLAVIDFQEVAPSKEVSIGLMMTNLVQGGLIQSSPCRVLTLEYLKDIRRRRFGETGSVIEAQQALEIARTAGASALVFADILDSDADAVVSWRLVDTATGEALGAGRCRSPEIFALADSTVAGILPALTRSCGAFASSNQESVTLSSTTSAEAYEHYLAGRQATESSDLARARSEFLSAIDLDPDFALAYFELSRDWAIDARESWAEKAWVRRDRLTIRDRLRLEAWRMRLSNRLAEARKTYTEILERWPDDLKTLRDFSETLGQWSNHRERLHVVEKGLRLYPSDLQLQLDRIRSTAALWQSTKVLEIARSTSDSIVANPAYLATIGIAHLQLGQRDEARRHFLRAIDIAPTFDDEVLRSGPHALIALCEGDLDEAIALTNDLLEADDLSMPERGILLGVMSYGNPGLAELHRLAGRFKTARSILDSVTDLPYESDIDQWSYEIAVGRSLLRWGYPEQAYTIAAPLARMHDERMTEQRAARLLARSLVALDSLDAAREQVRRIEQWEGGLFERFAHWTKAEIALAEGRPDEAIAELAEIDPFGMGMYDIDIRVLRARAYLQGNRTDEAVATLVKLVGVYGGYSPAHYQLAMFYEQQERWSEAIKAYERFLELWYDADEDLPQLVTARTRLAALESGH